MMISSPNVCQEMCVSRISVAVGRLSRLSVRVRLRYSVDVHTGQIAD